MVLIIDDTLKASEPWRRILYEHNALNYAATLRTYKNELESNNYHVIFIPRISAIPSFYDFYVKFIREYKNIGIVALNDSEINSKCFDMEYLTVLEPNSRHSKITEALNMQMEMSGIKSANSMICNCVRLHRDFMKNTVNIFGLPVMLNNLQYKILLYLAKAAPNPASVENIIKFAFRPNADVKPNNVATQISYINKSVLPYCNYRLIEFIRGKGYKIASKNELTDEYIENILKINPKMRNKSFFS